MAALIQRRHFQFEGRPSQQQIIQHFHRRDQLAGP